MCLWLQQLGAEVTGYALEPPSNPNMFEVAKVCFGMQSIIADVRDAKALANAMHEAQPEIVIHMAAQALVLDSYQNPIETYNTNIMGTVHLLDAVRNIESICAVVIITSDKCYENKEWPWGYRENDYMGGYDPYSSSKGCAELVVSAYRSSYFNPTRYHEHGVAIGSVRAGNVIGGGDWAANRLIPDMVRFIKDQRPVPIRSPHAIRPFQHVLEPLSGYLTLAERLFTDGPVFGEGFNFGPNDEDTKPVQWIVERFVQLWGENASWVIDENLHSHEAHFLKLDCSKSRARLDWHPKWRLSDALERIIEWHKAALDLSDMKQFTINQIKDYENTRG
jgi:CDP-glucose 4,6-dehydratase